MYIVDQIHGLYLCHVSIIITYNNMCACVHSPLSPVRPGNPGDPSGPNLCVQVHVCIN